MDVWDYPKSERHQAAIDAMKTTHDIAASRVVANKGELRREKDAALAVRERETEKIAIRAKTARLRAARLAREAEGEAQVKSKPSRAKTAKPRTKK